MYYFLNIEQQLKRILVNSSTVNSSTVNISNLNNSKVNTVNNANTANVAQTSMLASSSSSASTHDFISNANFDFNHSSVTLNAPPGPKNLRLESIESLLMCASTTAFDSNMEFENTDESISFME